MNDSLSIPSLNQRIEELESQLSEYRQAYDLLEERATRNQDLIEHLPHEVHVWRLIRNDDGSIRTWRLDHANPAAMKAWGQSLGDVVGHIPREIFSDEHAVERFMPIEGETRTAIE